MQEVWKSVEGYEGIYEVSNFGNVRSLDRYDNNSCKRNGKMLVPHNRSKGYKAVHLSKDGIARWYSVHRLVAFAFIEKKPGCDIINHLDNNPSNNRIDNLEWTTYKGNMQHAARQGRMHGKPDNFLRATEKRKTPIIATKENGEEMLFPSQVEAGRYFNVQSSHIAAACRKEYGYKRLKGIEFRYADPELQARCKPKKVGRTKEELREYHRKRMLGNKIMVGRHLSDATKAKLVEINSKSVIQLTKDGEEVARYRSVAEAMRVTNIKHICDVANNRKHRNTAGGFLWRWAEE